MKNSVALIFQLSGAALLVMAFFGGGTMWEFLLGGGLIVAPYTAAAMFISYILLIACLIGSAVFGAYMGVQIGGKDSVFVFVGLIAGGVAGYRITTSDFFYKALNPARKMSELDDES